MSCDTEVGCRRRRYGVVGAPMHDIVAAPPAAWRPDAFGNAEC